jgi:adenylate kinase
MRKTYSNIIVTGKSGAGKQPRIDVLVETFGLKQLSTGDIFRTYLGLFNDTGFDGDLARFYDDTAERFVPDGDIMEALRISAGEQADGVVLGLKAAYFVNQGLFVPDAITNALFESAFCGMDCSGAVLDGYPRTLSQARFLTALAEREQTRLDAVLLVENDDENIIRRTTGRRICKTCGDVYHVEHKPPPQRDACKKPDRNCNIVARSDDTTESLKTRLREFRTKTRPAIDYLTEQGIPLYRVPGNLAEFSPEAVRDSVFEAMQIG